MKLSPPQLNALRFYDPGDTHVNFGPTARTRDSLIAKGLLVRTDSGTKLTFEGSKLIREYVVASGNGPEDLKARFSFLRGR